MPQPLLDRLPEIAARLEAASDLLIFLDFDGTLAPVVSDPSLAFMPPQTLRALKSLAAIEKVSLAIISGRALQDLKDRVGMPNLIYAGNHGLEISGPGVYYIQPDAGKRVQALSELARELQIRLQHIPGVEIENKVLSASVHYRRAPADKMREIHQLTNSVVSSSGGQFQMTSGLQVFEIRPRVSWNKGKAVLWIKEAWAKRDALPVYVGDDATDEDAFLALPEGITVSVGSARKTSARYYLEDQGALQSFLGWLIESTPSLVGQVGNLPPIA
jgi:trehalose 6-phosphate phosphatase